MVTHVQCVTYNAKPTLLAYGMIRLLFNRNQCMLHWCNKVTLYIRRTTGFMACCATMHNLQQQQLARLTKRAGCACGEGVVVSVVVGVKITLNRGAAARHPVALDGPVTGSLRGAALSSSGHSSAAAGAGAG